MHKTLDYFLSGFAKKDRVVLAQAITLIESIRKEDRDLANKLLTSLMPKAKGSFRIGMCGIPGVGKSTFMEELGMLFLKENPNLSLAILAIDPSSPLSGGSLMGDKVRMENLSRDPRVFIRPSPGGDQGGISRRSREVLFLLEAFGFHWVFMETIGSGQAEYAIADIVDVLLFLQMPHTGDDLQNLKKGVLELADLIVVNKADGALKNSADQSKESLEALLKEHRDGWKPPVILASAMEHLGHRDIIQSLLELKKSREGNGEFTEKRKRQLELWFRDELSALVLDELLSNAVLLKQQKTWMDEVLSGKTPAPTGARECLTKLLENFPR